MNQWFFLFVSVFLAWVLVSVTYADFLGDNYQLNDYLLIPASTVQASTGGAYDATSIKYRIYKDGNQTEIVADANMTKFDSVTGFYQNRIQLTAGAGFEVNKGYVILIQATVDGISAHCHHTFRITSGVNIGQVGGSAIPVPADTLFSDLITATGAGTTINLDASGHVTPAAGSITGTTFDASTAYPWDPNTFVDYILTAHNDPNSLSWYLKRGKGSFQWEP